MYFKQQFDFFNAEVEKHVILRIEMHEIWCLLTYFTYCCKAKRFELCSVVGVEGVQNRLFVTYFGTSPLYLLRVGEECNQKTFIRKTPSACVDFSAIDLSFH